MEMTLHAFLRAISTRENARGTAIAKEKPSYQTTLTKPRTYHMMLHKIFHMNQSVSEAKNRLAGVSAYRRHLAGVEKADFTGHGLSHWSLSLPLGFKADFVLSETETNDPNSLVFKSLDGDLEIFGMVTFHPVKSGLTEVEIMLNYESNSRVFNLLDKMFNLGDYFMINQLRRVRAHFEGIAKPAPRPVNFFAHQELKAA